MPSSKYAFIKNMYRMRRITARDVWTYADAGDITEKEAIAICGPRPRQEG